MAVPHLSRGDSRTNSGPVSERAFEWPQENDGQSMDLRVDAMARTRAESLKVPIAPFCAHGGLRWEPLEPSPLSATG